MGQGAGTTTGDGMGEGGIPAPKFYSDITSCAGGMLPGPSTATGTASLLGKGGLLDSALDGSPTDATAVIGDDATGAAERTDLLLLLDPTMTSGGSANCANDVARGYTLATDLYDEYTRTNALAESRTATDAARERFRKGGAAHNAHRESFRKAETAYNAYGGAVFDKVYAQQMRHDAADRAITAYNNLVGPDGELASLGSGMGTGAGTTATDGTGYSDIVVDNFVAAPDVRITDTEAAGYADKVRQLNRVYGSMGVRGYQAIRGRTDGGVVISLDESARDNALTAAQTAGNLDTRAQEENLRRAKAGRDHVQGELNRLTSIVRNQNRDIVTAEQFVLGTGASAVTYASERQVVDAYLAAERRVTTAAGNVRSTVTALDNANKALKRELGDADSYLSQLVRLRQYEKGVADTELTEAGGANAAQSFRDAVKEAQDAERAAIDLQETHDGLTGDSPAGNLLSALLESDDDKEDDGLALVNAVSDVHSATVDNKDEIDSLKDHLTDEDGNPIDLSDMGDLEGVQDSVTENSNDIIVSSWFARSKKPSKSRSTIHP